MTTNTTTLETIKLETIKKAHEINARYAGFGFRIIVDADTVASWEARGTTPNDLETEVSEYLEDNRGY